MFLFPDRISDIPAVAFLLTAIRPGFDAFRVFTILLGRVAFMWYKRIPAPRMCTTFSFHFHSLSSINRNKLNVIACESNKEEDAINQNLLKEELFVRKNERKSKKIQESEKRRR